MPAGKGMVEMLAELRAQARDLLRHRVTRNFLSGAILQVLSQAVSLAIVVYLARELGPTSYGLLNMTMAIMAYFILLMTFGLPIIGTREVARKNDASMQIWWDIAALRTALAIVTYAILIVIALSVPALHDMRVLLILYGTSMFFIALFPDWTFIGLERMAWVALAQLIGSALTLGLLVALVHSSGNLKIAIVCVLAGSVLGLLILLVRLRQLNSSGPRLVIQRARLYELIRVAFPFIFASLSSQVYGNADLILVGFIRGKAQAGIYAAAYKVINLLAILIALISQATYPAMARVFKSDPEKRNAFARAMTAAMLAIFLPIALGGTLIAGNLTRFFYGAKYAATAEPMAILLWYVFFSALSISFANALLATNEDRPYITAITVGAIIDLALISFMVPLWGANGAAIAMVIAESFILVYLGIQAHRKLKIGFMRARVFLPILVSTLVMTAVVWALRKHLMVLLVIVCATLVYGLTLGACFFLTYKGPGQEA